MELATSLCFDLCTDRKDNMRILGLDFGSKTVGVAVSDELLITAQGVEIIRREKPTPTKTETNRHLSAILVRMPF